MGNHKSELISAVKSLQYGEQSFPFPVESSSDVRDNLGSRVEFPHPGDLPLNVSALLGGTDLAVADCFRIRLSSEEGVGVVEALSAGVGVEGGLPWRA